MKPFHIIIGLAVIFLASAASAAPVHVALTTNAVVSPNADGFFTLGAVAQLTGGDTASRIRLSDICVGRAPLSGENRLLTRGDLALKLRQAGCNPDKDAIIEGAAQATVTVGIIPPAPNNGGAREMSAVLTSPVLGVGGQPLIHRGDPVSIVVQSESLTITARGIARDNGGVGDIIRVHRDGVMTDLTVTVLDAQTVRLEI